jgi:hypothetical protein
MKIKVMIYNDTRYGKPFDATCLLAGLVEVGVGTLTDEHATASYGQPVLLYDGSAYGVADVPVAWEITPAQSDWPGSHEPPYPQEHPLLNGWNHLRYKLLRGE